MPDEMDELLDAALHRYVEKTPRHGLERRVLKHVHAVRVWRLWLPAAAMLAAACIFLMTPKASVPLPVPQPRPITHPLVAGSAELPAVLKASLVSPKPRHPRARSAEPAKLSDGERGLLRFLAADPESAHRILGEALVAMNRPITIEGLKIEPLGIPELEDQIKEMKQ